jgi:hypothetical protein
MEETQNNINIENENTNENIDNQKNKLSRIESIQSLKSNPPELPLVNILTIEPQILEMVGRLVHILNDPILFNKFKQTIHKKFDLTIHNIDKEINTKVKGGGESYFTQEECSFF